VSEWFSKYGLQGLSQEEQEQDIVSSTGHLFDEFDVSSNLGAELLQDLASSSNATEYNNLVKSNNYNESVNIQQTNSLTSLQENSSISEVIQIIPQEKTSNTNSNNTPTEEIKNNNVVIKNEKVKANPFAKKNKKIISFEDVKNESKDEIRQESVNTQSNNTSNSTSFNTNSNINVILDSLSNNQEEKKGDSRVQEKLDRLGNATGIGSSHLFGNSQNDEVVQKRLNGLGGLKGIDSSMLRDDKLTDGDEVEIKDKIIEN